MPTIKINIPHPYIPQATVAGTQGALAIYTRQLEDFLRQAEGSINALTTSDIPEGSNLYYTDARARAALSATAPITYNPSTGGIACNSSSANTALFLVRRDATGSFSAQDINCNTLVSLADTGASPSYNIRLMQVGTGQIGNSCVIEFAQFDEADQEYISGRIVSQASDVTTLAQYADTVFWTVRNGALEEWSRHRPIEDCFQLNTRLGVFMNASTDSRVQIANGGTTIVPLKFVSGSLITTPTVGGFEFLTDKVHFTITTGAARKEFTLNDIALTSGRVPFTTTNGRLSDNSNFTWDNTNRMLAISTASTSTSCVEITKTEHSSALQSAFRCKDSTGQECVGFTPWSGGGGTGGYGSIVVSSTGGSAIRLGEIGGKNNTNGFRVCDFIFQTGTAADLGEIVTLLGAGSGSFAYAQYIGANGTAFKLSSAPTAKVHIAAGSTAASSAPLKFTSGSLMTTAEAGAVEFLTDKGYLTITTGAARKEFTLNDGSLTSGRVPFATTNGRLTDSANMTFAGSTLTVNTLNLTTALGEVYGGTGESAYTLGDILYSDATNSLARLAGNTTTTKKFLTQTGNGSVSAAPSWDAVVDGYTLNVLSVVVVSPADSTTYYFGSAQNLGLTSTFNDQRVYVPKSGTLKSVFVRVRVAGTLGSGESVTHAIRVNDTTDVALNSMTYTAATQSDVTTGLSQAVSAGDYIVLKVATPAWATNPTSVTLSAQLFIE